MSLVGFLLLLCLTSLALSYDCQHDHHAHNMPRHFFNDLSAGRLLQATETGRLRIFADYTQVTMGTATEINTIKRIVNISASYFYNVLNVTRLPRLFYPRNVSLQCNSLKIPDRYVTEGVIGDLGVVCGNENIETEAYIAKALPCAFLQSNKRPIWGMIMFNNINLRFDQQGFQEIMYIGLHELTHILGFSAAIFDMYPRGSPLVNDSTGAYYLSTPRLQQQIRDFFNCTSSKGLPLEDQDGTLIASHWEKKVVGNEYMIASNRKGSFMSRFTLALLQSSGFYASVNYAYAEPSVWGRGKGCSFLNIDDCSAEQFCNDRNFRCDTEGTGIGRCNVDLFTGSCMISKIFTNTICVDEAYELKNLNARLNALERGGSSSRCFDSSFRQEGIEPTPLNNRCYISVCSASGKFLYILVGSYILVCRDEGQVIQAPPGLNGTLTCPRKFSQYCQNKKTCPFHCNKNGACINGQCLCTGNTIATQSCLDVSILRAPIGSTGGLLNAFIDQVTALDLTGSTTTNASSPALQRRSIVTYSIDSKCIQGSAFERVFGECLTCSQLFGCQNCNDDGCTSCDNGRAPVNSRC